METDFPPVTPSPFSAGEPKDSTLAMVSLGLGVAGIPFLCLSVVFGVCGCFSGLLGIAALVTGFIARQKIRAGGEQGNGLALTGMIVGGAQTILVFCIMLFWFALALLSIMGQIFSTIGSGLK